MFKLKLLERKIRNIRKNFFYEKNIKTELELIQKRIDNLKYELCDEIINKSGKNIKLPQVMSIEETIERIINEKLSVCRYGDGEFYYLLGEAQYYGTEKFEILENKLKEILAQSNPKILTCIWDKWGSLETYTTLAQKNVRNTIHIHRRVYNYLNLNYKYGNADITRPYLAYKDKSTACKRFNLIKKIWNNRDIVIVEGEGSRLGVGNDLFDNTTSINRVLCPAENVFAQYDKIVDFCSSLPKDKLILIALGMTATVLAYDLAQLGYQAIDIGHIDIEYECYLRQVNEVVNIEGKYINEIGKRVFEPVKDSKYLDSIIKNIL